MIELQNDSLTFSFLEVHKSARLTIDFQRTLRIPDDDSTYTAEEQVSGKAEHGGLQIMVYPMKREVYKRRFPKTEFKFHEERLYACSAMPCEPDAMGLAPGGRMRQEICRDRYRLSDWDLDHGSRCFVHISNSMVWRALTGGEPPTTPPTSREYTEAGLPWFEWYDDRNHPITGAETLGAMKSVAELGKEKQDVPLPENESVDPENIVRLRKDLKPGQVREWQEASTL